MIEDWYTQQAMTRYGDLLREAEERRLVAEALSSRNMSHPLRSRWLNWLGARLVEQGSRMQSRHGETPEWSTAPSRVPAATGTMSPEASLYISGRYRPIAGLGQGVEECAKGNRARGAWRKAA